MLQFFDRKRRKRELPPRPKWIMWLFILCVFYALFMVSKADDNSLKQAVKNLSANIENNPTIDDFSEYKNKIFPQYAAGLRISDLKSGKGLPVICGQKVSISYKSFLMQGNELADFASEAKPLRFTIGDGKAMPAFNEGVVGMKVGAERSVIAPPLMSYGLDDYKRDDVPKGSTIRFEIKLISASPDLPEISDEIYRVAELAAGSGAAVSCGEEVSVAVTIWNINGKKLYETSADSPLKITPGKSQTMLGLEQGIIGMRPAGKRLFIIPPTLQKTMNGNKPEISFPTTEGQIIVAEVVFIG